MYCSSSSLLLTDSQTVRFDATDHPLSAMPSPSHAVSVAVVYVADRLPDSFGLRDVLDVLGDLRAEEEHAVGLAASRFEGEDAAGILDALVRAEWATLADAGPPARYVLHRGALPL